MKKHAKTGLRLLLGLIYFVFGLNGFLHFIPQPQTMPEGAAAFAGAMMNTGYFFPVLKATEIMGGLGLLSGCFAPVFLVILAPITLQIVLFHAFLAPSGMYLQVAMLLIHLSLGWFYRAAYEPMFKCKSC